MDKLGDALAELVKQGTPLAGQIATRYLVFRVFDDLIGYLVPWGAIVFIVILIIRQIRRYNEAHYKEGYR